MAAEEVPVVDEQGQRGEDVCLRVLFRVLCVIDSLPRRPPLPRAIVVDGTWLVVRLGM